jgi:hypothetical protein
LQRLLNLFFFISCRNNDGNPRNVPSQIARDIFQILYGTVPLRNIDSPKYKNAKTNRRKDQ